MAWSSTSITTGEVLALESDAPLIVPYNLVADASVLKWTAGGGGADADVTVSTAPARWVHDGELRYGSTRTAGSATTHYFNLQWASAITFDSLFLKILGSTTLTDVAIQISDDGTAWITTLASWTGSLSPTGRFTALELNSGNNRFSGTGYMRIVFTFGSSSSAPSIGEFVVGRRRQISRRPDQGSGYDDAPRGIAFADQTFRGRARQRYIEAEGFSDWIGSFSPDGSDRFGLDDITTLRAVIDDSNGLRLPVLWVDQPESFRDVATWGFLTFGSDGLRLPYDGWAIRSVDFKHEELPPFARNDTRYSG